ncbi:MAG TPA: dihydrodipicolinate synthase family protein [Candidatus Acidoferrum sp.]|nr:dihydrodipicolinate synthase family protein [Candidatus Acidoferrum sp.]
MPHFDVVGALRRSVIAVAPLARRSDLTIDRAQNARLLAHLRSGQVRTFMYGGNANLYHMGLTEFTELLALCADLALEGDWFIPSVGSDYGKALDQLRILRSAMFPTAMVLPHRFPSTPSGFASGLRRLADAYGRPLIAYVKDDGAVDPLDLARLVDDGAVCAIKYAIVRENPLEDRFLAELLALVDPSVVISGIGERPVIDHWTRFGLRAFTSGSVCVAPARSNAIREALARGDIDTARALREAFLPLEDLRDAHSPIRVIHEAVRLAGIADTGPMQPYLDNLRDENILVALEHAARALLAANDHVAAEEQLENA